MPDDDDLDPEPEPEPVAENHDLRRLREKARATDEAKAEADALRRELAFSKAGIDPDDPKQGYFVRGYQGDLTATAIKEAAEAAGFLGSATTTAEGMTDDERRAFANTAQAAAGGSNDAPPSDFYADWRNRSAKSGIPTDQFGISLAQALEAAGEEVSYQGPLREFPGDTGEVQLRPGIPIPPKR
jgi:hypothetical protein